MLQDMFGEDSVPKMFKGEKLFVVVNDKRADIDLISLVSTVFLNNVFFYKRKIWLTVTVCLTGCEVSRRRDVPTGSPHGRHQTLPVTRTASIRNVK